MRAFPRSRGLYDQRKVRGEKGKWKLKITRLDVDLYYGCIGQNRNNVGKQAQEHRPTITNPCAHTHILRLQGCGLAAADRDGCNVVTACVLCDRCFWLRSDQTTLHTTALLTPLCIEAMHALLGPDCYMASHVRTCATSYSSIVAQIPRRERKTTLDSDTHYSVVTLRKDCMK